MLRNCLLSFTNETIGAMHFISFCQKQKQKQKQQKQAGKTLNMTSSPNNPFPEFEVIELNNLGIPLNNYARERYGYTLHRFEVDCIAMVVIASAIFGLSFWLLKHKYNKTNGVSQA